jgi:hypothetical protein
MAAPGAVAAAVVIAFGAYLIVDGVLFAASLDPGDDFASIPTTVVIGGAVACAFGLLLAASTLIVSLARPRPVLLVLAALFTGCAATWTAIALLAGDTGGTGYGLLTAAFAYLVVFAYLAVAAVLRLLSWRRSTNA